MTVPDHVRINEVFRDETIEIDGTYFKGCQFYYCKIVFSGLKPVRFEECLFDSCEWVFAGPAANVLAYLSALYSGLGQSGQELVDSIVESIRRGTVTQGIHQMHPVPA